MRPHSQARIGGVLARVQADPEPVAGTQWQAGVIDALRWVLRADVPSLAAYEQQYERQVRTMDRAKVEEYLGFGLADDEWQRLHERALASGRWT